MRVLTLFFVFLFLLGCSTSQRKPASIGEPVDILFYFENKQATDAFNRGEVRDRINFFLDQIKSEDFRIAVANYETSKLSHVGTAEPSNEVERKLGGEFSNLSKGKTQERGSAVSALRKLLAEDGSMIRPRGSMHIVLVSPLDQKGASREVESFIKDFQKKYPGKKLVVNSIVNDDPTKSECIKSQGKGATLSESYKRLSELTGGFVYDMCTYGTLTPSMFENIGRRVYDDSVTQGEPSRSVPAESAP